MSNNDSEEITVQSVFGKNNDTPVVKNKKEKSREKLMNKQDNLISMGMAAFDGFSIRAYFLLFIIVILILSDVFVDKVLTNFQGAVEANETTSYGVTLQALFITLSQLFISCFMKI